MQELGTSRALKRLAWLASSAAALSFAALPSAAAANQGNHGDSHKHGKSHHHGDSHHHGNSHKPGAIGSVFSETNGTSNQLLVFNRYSDGSLKLHQTVDTGGNGGQQAEPGCPGSCPLLDAQGEVSVTNGGKLVFAVNAGSNEISAFAVHHGSAELVNKVPSGGMFPNSITTHGNVLYVLNTNSENIAGFRFNRKGKLTPITGSAQPLTTEAAPLSRQIGFDNSGRVLVVSLLTDATFDTFQVKHGVAGPATAHPSSSPEPFGFSFDPRHNHMVSVEVVNDMDFTQSSNASSYSLSASGALSSIDTVPTQGYAGCWTEITRNGHWAFIVNTGGPSPFGAIISTFALAPSGKLTFKSTTAKDGEFTLTDEVLAPDDKYLYVVAPLINNPFVMPPPATNGSKIVTFKVGKDGTLSRISETTDALAPGVSGIAAS